MKLSNLLVLKKNKNTRLAFALFSVLFLNFIWIQSDLFSPKEKGHTVLSSSRAFYRANELCGNFTGGTTSYQNLNNNNSTIRTQINIDRRRRRTVEYSTGSGSRSNVTLSKEGNMTECGEAVTTYGSTNITEGNQVHQVTINLERDLECDSCDGLPSSPGEVTVYLIGDAPSTADLRRIAQALAEEDTEQIEEFLEERSRNEKIRRCQINPETDRPFRRNNAEEHQAYLECRINYVASSDYDEPTDQDRALRRLLNEMLSNATRAKNQGDYSLALSILDSVIDSSHFGLFSEARQNRVRALKEITEVYSEVGDVTVTNPITGEIRDYNFQEFLRTLATAKLEGNDETYNSLLSVYNQLNRELRLKFLERKTEFNAFGISDSGMFNNELDLLQNTRARITSNESQDLLSFLGESNSTSNPYDSNVHQAIEHLSTIITQNPNEHLHQALEYLRSTPLNSTQ